MMKPKPATLKKSLLSIVRGMSLALQPFVRNPKKDFTRKRKLSFEFMMLTLLRMGGGSIANELMAARDILPDLPLPPPSFSMVFQTNHTKETYRYLTDGRYKIIFTIDEGRAVVKIRYVWDSRQDNSL